MKIKLTLYFVLLITISFYFLHCNNKNDNLVLSIPIKNYKNETFISVDYTFLNEGLHKPSEIRINPITHDIVVLDEGNVCLYVFSSEGKFIRKIGNIGQGPGDLLGPAHFEIDRYGIIYVYEKINLRISKFSSNGKFIKSFRINSLGSYPSFTIDDNQNIIARVSGSGYYITVFSQDGEHVKNIGVVPEINKKFPQINDEYARNFAFKKNGDYIVFLKHLPMIKIFDDSGNLIKEISLLKEIELTTKLVNVENLTSLIYQNFYHEIILRDNYFYILLNNREDLLPQLDNVRILVLDNKFNLINKINLPLKNKLKIISGGLRLKFEYEPQKNIIYLPFIQNSEILSFKHLN